MAYNVRHIFFLWVLSFHTVDEPVTQLLGNIITPTSQASWPIPSTFSPIPNPLRWIHMTCSCFEFTRPEMAGVSLPHITMWMTAAPGLQPWTRNEMQNTGV